MGGQRTMIAVFDMKAAADMPRIAEPLFMELGGSDRIHAVHNADDLKTGVSAIS
jgi:hypothetical protein